MARVLIVDDDADIRAVVILALEDVGCPVEECDGSDAALDWLRANVDHEEAAVILLDDHMPAGRGVDLLRLLVGDDGLRAHHRFILMTADPQGAHTAQQDPVLRGVLSDVLIKPFDLDVLIALVRQWQDDLG